MPAIIVNKQKFASNSPHTEEIVNTVKPLISNPNLLDNGWFNVNSRSKSNYSGTVYSADRWLIETSTLTLNSESITLQITQNNGSLTQYFEEGLVNNLFGKEVTLSVLLADGTLLHDSAKLPSSYPDSATTYISIPLGDSMEAQLRIYTSYSTKPRVRIIGNANDSVSIKAIKLEVGIYSTLLNDIAPDREEELFRCAHSFADPQDILANKPYNPIPSNENLLMNPFFTINQRGVTSGSAYGYMFDRWIFDYGTSSSWNWDVDHIEIHKDGRLIQRLGHGLAGKTVTFSYLDYLDRIHSGTVVLGSGDTVILQNGIVRVLWTESGKALYIYNIAPDNHSIGIKAVKLEYGTVSTLANDTVPDYATELLKCQRYYVKYTSLNGSALFGIGYNMKNTNLGYVSIPLSVPLRTLPTMVVNGGFRIGNNASWDTIYYDATGLSVHSFTRKEPISEIILGYTLGTNHGQHPSFASCEPVILYAKQTNDSIEFSADL